MDSVNSFMFQLLLWTARST